MVPMNTPSMLLFVGTLLIATNSSLVNSLSIAVFGGSGFLGRRVCQELVSSGHEVTSVSRKGRPPPYYTGSNDAENCWADKVNWLSYNVNPDNLQVLELPNIDAGISCIGNVNPDPNWDKLSFFGLSFDDETLYNENGIFNECAARFAKNNGAKRFVFMSVSYEIAKMVEGPIDGYTRGKRHAEHVICDLFGAENSIVLGPSLIYGGKRFPVLGKIYRKFAKSGAVKFYAKSMDALRNLSSSPIEDWVEKSLLSPPVEVNVVARVACASALGMVTKDMVGERRQGFCNDEGKPVYYDDVVYIDGTAELERVDELVHLDLPAEDQLKHDRYNKPLTTLHREGKDPLWEGGLVGKTPYLYPVPIISIFSALFYIISTGQFVNH